MILSESKSTLPPPKILLGGEPGCGKTALMTTLGEGMQVLALDNQMATCKTLKDSLFVTRNAVDVIDCVEPNPQRADSYQKVKTRLIQILNGDRKLSNGKPLTSLGIDGLTALAKSALDYVLFNSGKLGQPLNIKNNASQPEWGLMIGEIIQIFQIVRSLPIPVVISCHYAKAETPSGGLCYEMALQTKQLPLVIPGMVDELWFMETRIQPVGVPMQRVLRTVATPMITCRSNFNLPDGTDTSKGLKDVFQKMGVVIGGDAS